MSITTQAGDNSREDEKRKRAVWLHLREKGQNGETGNEAEISADSLPPAIVGGWMKAR